MSYRDWLPNPPIGVGIIVIAALLALASANHYKNVRCGDGPTPQQCQSAAQVATPVAAVQTPPPEQNPNRTEWRSERDLEAQFEMAHWAKVSAIAALIALVVTGIGIVFVYQTLNANRAAVLVATRGSAAAEEAIQVTRRAHVIEQRPWIAVRPVKMSNGILGKDFISACLWIRFTNIGKTPALNVATHWLNYQRIASSTEMIANFGPQLAQWGAIYPGKTLVPDDWFELGFSVSLTGKDILANEAPVYEDQLILKTSIGAAYRSVVSEELFRSARSYMVTIKQVTEGSVADNLLDFYELDGGSDFT